MSERLVKLLGLRVVEVSSDEAERFGGKYAYPLNEHEKHNEHLRGLLRECYIWLELEAKAARLVSRTRAELER